MRKSGAGDPKSQEGLLVLVTKISVMVSDYT